MKERILPSTVLVMTSIILLTNAIAQPTELPNPVVWWRFDDGNNIGKDWMGTADGTLNNSWGWSSMGGKPGGKIELNNDGYLEADEYKGITGGDSRTCTAWIKTFQTSGEIVSWGSDSGNGSRWIIRISEAGTLRTEVSGGNILGTTIINDGNWHHITVALENDGSPDITEARLYVDGQLEAISASVDEPVNTGAVHNVKLGVYSGTQRYFNGDIDEVRIYNTALNSNQILEVATIPFEGGDGDYGNPFFIYTTQDLYTLSVRPDYWDYHFRLMSDIDLTQSGQPQPHMIGTDPDNPFTGSFDGNHHSIKGLTKTEGPGYVGLFGCLKGDNGFRTISDLTLDDAVVTVSGNGRGAAGILCGYAADCDIYNCNLTNCRLMSDVNDTFSAGTLAGEIGNSTIDGITCTSTVQGDRLTGGLIGRVYKSFIFNCNVHGDVTGGQFTGGLFGSCEQNILNNCNFNGSVRGTLSTGSLSGEILLSSISRSTNTGTVQGGPLTGGLFGHTDHSSVYNCRFDGDVNGTISIGGLTGKLETSTVNKCCSNGSVTGDSSVGGFAGEISAMNNSLSHIKDCYSQSSVTGDQKVGGFVGYCQPICSIQHCYSAGTVTGTDQVGAFAGYSDLQTDYLDCFWDIQINPGLPGISNSIDLDLVGETTAVMQTQETYINAGWDFAGEVINERAELWAMSSSPAYPTLTLMTPYPGSGTTSNPYRIYIKEHLLSPLFIEGTSNTINIKLMNDIDFQGGHCPLLFQRWGFRGVFDGNHKCIKNIYANQGGFINGLHDSSTVLKNLTLINPVLTVTQKQNLDCGLLAGWISEYTIIDNCHVINGDITTPLDYDPDNNIWGSTVGGLVWINNGTLRNCTFSGAVKGTHSAGIAAYNYETGLIENCHASIKVTGRLVAGGLCGGNQGAITGCSSQGSVSTEGTDTSYFADTGGLVGENRGRSIYDEYLGDRGVIFDSYSTCDVSTYGRAAGGLVGSSWSGWISNCYASGSVTGYSYLGGFVGTIQTSTHEVEMGLIEECFSTGDVSGNNRIGGFAGESGSAYIRNCYSTGSATGVSITGGFMGTNYFYPYNGYGEAVIEKCYSTGKVTGGNETGGFVGRHWNQSVRVFDSFWDTQTSGRTYSSGGTGKTTAQMQMQSTFTGWNFGSVWYMAGYPVLQWEINPLQAQINAATDGDTIIVSPGVYEGRLYMKGKNITLTSIDPTDPAIVAATVIQGRGIGPVITFDGTENETCRLTGFTLTGGITDGRGGGICGNHARAGISHCVIQNNTADHGGGLADCDGTIEQCIIEHNSAINNGGGFVYCAGLIVNCLIKENSADYGGGFNNCDGNILNCTIAGNTASVEGGGLRRCDGSITNCIIWGNDVDNIFEGSQPTYSCYPEAVDGSNISSDPLFANATAGDYHLLLDSPCIDAGDPASDYMLEPLPNGARINIGAYGNTQQATQSPNGGLVLLGFEIVNKTRTARTVFEYELALTVRNTNPYTMTEIQMQLVDMDEAVIAVSDGQIVMTSIGPDEIQTSQDTFSLTIDRSQPLAGGRLTWELTYYSPGQSQPMSASLTMPLSAIDPTPCDITGEGDVNLDDFRILSQQWQGVPGIPSADVAEPQDNYVGIEDLLWLCENWLY